MIARALSFVFASAAASIAFVAPAHAREGWGEDVQVIVDEEMDDLRGGFDIPGTNISVGFGATVTTFVNGTPVLTTNLTWTDAGAIVDQTIAAVGQNLNELSAEQRAAFGIDGLEGAGGVVINDEAGVTALVHNVTEGALQNIIINNATGRDIEQDIDVTLTLPGFDLIQDALVTERLGIQINEDMRGYFD